MKNLTYFFLMAWMLAASALGAADTHTNGSHSPKQPAEQAHGDEAQTHSKEEKKPFKEFPLVIIVNEANPLTNLSQKQIELIFSGDAADWRALGDKEQYARVYAPGPMQDAHQAFIQLGLEGREYGPDVHFYDNSDVILAKVSQYENAIGLVAFPFMRTEGIKVLAVDTLPPTVGNYPYTVTEEVLAKEDQATQSHGEHAHWSYEGDTGPEHWGDLSPAYKLCKTGMRQSPINLAEATVQAGEPLNFQYQPSPIRLVNNGHTIQFNYTPGSYVVYQGKRYELKQFHFHSKSEHTIEKNYSNLEMHLVHAADDGELLVVGIMFDKGPLNRFLSRLWPFLPREEGESYESEATIDAQKALPVIRNLYSYSGSLTTPPGTEGVNWFVFAEPVSLSPSQLEQFRALYKGNYRPIQPLNGRAIRLFTR